jgi:hypothetical protein
MPSSSVSLGSGSSLLPLPSPLTQCPSSLGLVLAFNYLAQTIGCIVMGSISDRCGRRQVGTGEGRRGGHGFEGGGRRVVGHRAGCRSGREARRLLRQSIGDRMEAGEAALSSALWERHGLNPAPCSCPSGDAMLPHGLLRLSLPRRPRQDAATGCDRSRHR